MAEPTYDSVVEYVLRVESEIRKATATWKAYGYAASKAYSQAYADQGRVLSQVNANLEKLRKKEEQVATFALTILTVGVAGPFAAEITRDVFEKGSEVVKEELVHLVNIGLERTAEWAADNLASGSPEEAFKPAGIPPDQYGDELQGAIETQTGALEGTVLDFLKKGSVGMTMPRAQTLYGYILNSDFIKTPPAVTDKHELRRHAGLALWLGWAWARDQDYWEEHSSPSHFRKELESFDPVRKVLRDQYQLGPYVEQAFFVEGPPVPHMPRRPLESWSSPSTQERGPSTQVTLIDMYQFIQWSYSPRARAALFEKVRTHPLGQRYAEMQIQQHLLEATLKRLGYYPNDGD